MLEKRGFALAETLVVMVLIILLLLFIIILYSTTHRGLRLYENHVNAAFLGKSLLDDARKSGFDNILPAVGNYTFNTVKDGKEASQTINYNLDVQDIDTDKKLVWATMTWHEASGDKEVVLETIIVDTTDIPGNGGDDNGDD
ncbi:MAG: hypothetical protein J7M18_07815 [Candidatus Eremiobacteraeota bacterium]|nr:hypothetical protein [Candidatus Eremiobacteraeota bacterium]